MDSSLSSRRGLVLAGLVVTIGLLIPGLVTPVIQLRGTLDPQGVEQLVPQILEQGISDETVAALRTMINPAMLPLIELAPGGLKGALVARLGPEIGRALANGSEIEVYNQTRSILGSVRHLYRVGSTFAASLILLFSVVVPFSKALMVLWAIYRRDPARRRRTLRFVEVIAKWSMADVFAVALFIAYLAAAASQAGPGATAYQVVRFSATFGPGFYWFAAYCLASLAHQQLTARWIMSEEGTGNGALTRSAAILGLGFFHGTTRARRSRSAQRRPSTAATASSARSARAAWPPSPRRRHQAELSEQDTLTHLSAGIEFTS